MAAPAPSIHPERGGLVLSLPVTAPTSKVRAKRPRAGRQAEPLATRQTAFSPEDYLEWQISYDTTDPEFPTALGDLSFQKEGRRETFYPCELAFLVQHAKGSGLLSAGDFEELCRLASGDVEGGGIEESEKIIESEENVNWFPPAQQYGFRRSVRLTPRYVKMCENYVVEVQVSPKQRAVGNQAMIYLCIPIKFCTDEEDASPIGRVAKKNESLKFKIQRNNADMIKDTVIAFLLASQRHRQDIHRILERMK